MRGRAGVRPGVDMRTTIRPGVPRSGESLPSICFIPRTSGHSGAMSKLIFDNRAVGALFAFLLVVNAFALQHGWYGA